MRKTIIVDDKKEFREDMFGTWTKSDGEYCVFERAKKSSRGAYIKYKWQTRYGIERATVDKKYAWMLVKTLIDDGYSQSVMTRGGMDKLVGWFGE